VLRGVAAVVDKDLTAAMVAIELGADRLIILTDVSAVMRDFGTPDQTPVPSISVDDLPAWNFPAGSMGPKIEACRRFVAKTSKRATIGALEDVAGLLDGTAGTSIEPGQS
jgi:carbamate kinase